MAPKKKAAKAKGGKDDEDDTSTADLLAHYKKNCKLEGIPISKCIVKQLDEKLEEDVDLQEVLIDEKIGEENAFEFCKALKHVNKQEGYKHLESIRIWEGNLGNQGVRAFYLYISETKAYKIKVLEFINCNFDDLGCEFISRIINSPFNIKILNLDYNNIGNKGLMHIAKALATNTSVNYLSLNYCGITEDGVESLKAIFNNENNEIEKLFLQGNHIGNKGISDFLHLLASKEEQPLTEIHLSNTNIGKEANKDNLIGETHESEVLDIIKSRADKTEDEQPLINKEDDLLIALENVMKSNKSIHTYNLKYNLISPEGFRKITQILLEQKQHDDKHIYQVQIDEIYDSTDFKVFFDILKSRKKPKPRKPKKGGKEKKGGKKKG
jgi:Ran GTPase-activating protein (RanGAP) involved in mRNA processing and transport